MPTPSIQTLRADAQQVLNLDSISAVRSVVAATLANANAGTPLNPNLTTQQLWNEFYQIVTQPKSDIESIIANQLMKLLYAPPAPGGVGANGQVIFNDNGVLAGDPQFLWNKTTNLLTVTGNATITGDLTVDTNVLKVDSANDRVGIGTATPYALLHANGTIASANFDWTSTFTAPAVGLLAASNSSSASIRIATLDSNPTHDPFVNFLTSGGQNWSIGIDNSDGDKFKIALTNGFTGSSEIFAVDPSAVFSWYDGAGGTRMTLNSTGLGVGVVPSAGKGALQLSSGINFPATQVASSDANTLDDYEEGTFTATLTGGTSNPTTPVTTTARYTKVGRLVTVQIEFVNISNAGASGAIAITGLPFVNGSVAATGIATLYNLATFTGSPVVYLDTGASFLAFYGNVSSSAFSSVTHNSTTSGYSTTTITYSV